MTTTDVEAAEDLAAYLVNDRTGPVTLGVPGGPSGVADGPGGVEQPANRTPVRQGCDPSGHLV